GGKTGTAQKIDPVTHTYSHTRTVASFAGIAPINNPAISVAVVIDDPQVGTRYGGTTSAPVFAEVAQQVLEYLGVPHDQPLKPVKKDPTAQPKMELASAETPNEDPADLNALYDELNSLPEDDPLKQKSDAAVVAATAKAAPVQTATNVKKGVFAALPDKIMQAFREHGGSSFMTEDADDKPLPKVAPPPQSTLRPDGGVVVDASTKVAVPVFDGGLRSVIQKAAVAGLRVQPVGTGLAREQVPAAGTMVPIGTQVVVRFTR
ncbi:MAG TPA: penicillin-binding transpeptidase domain-containing protein, partial [Terriglobus sp.]